MGNQVPLRPRYRRLPGRRWCLHKDASDKTFSSLTLGRARRNDRNLNVQSEKKRFSVVEVKIRFYPLLRNKEKKKNDERKHRLRLSTVSVRLAAAFIRLSTLSLRLSAVSLRYRPCLSRCLPTMSVRLSTMSVRLSAVSVHLSTVSVLQSAWSIRLSIGFFSPSVFRSCLSVCLSAVSIRRLAPRYVTNSEGEKNERGRIDEVSHFLFIPHPWLTDYI